MNDGQEDTDRLVAEDIANMKALYNPDTGKTYGLRAIADWLGITYGRARHLDAKYNRSYDKPHRELTVQDLPEIEPVVSYVWDLETTNLNSFMGMLIVASFLDMATGEIDTRTVDDFFGDPKEQERELLIWTLEKMSEADILIGHNTIGFDMGFLRGRLALHHMDRELPRRQHWDTYQIARHGFKGRPQGYSLENLLDFFGIAVSKDKPSKHDWAASIRLDEAAVERIAARCEHDVLGNAYLFMELRPHLQRWKGR